MAATQWREEPDGFRYLDVDFVGGDTPERLETLLTACTACEEASGRVPILVHWESDGLDMAFFKEVKDANRRLRHLDIRAAFLGLGGRGGAMAALFNIRVGHERVRSFDGDAVALAWLKEERHGRR